MVVQAEDRDRGVLGGPCLSLGAGESAPKREHLTVLRKTPDSAETRPGWPRQRAVAVCRGEGQCAEGPRRRKQGCSGGSQGPEWSLFPSDPFYVRPDTSNGVVPPLSSLLPASLPPTPLPPSLPPSFSKKRPGTCTLSTVGAPIPQF